MYIEVSQLIGQPRWMIGPRYRGSYCGKFGPDFQYPSTGINTSIHKYPQGDVFCLTSNTQLTNMGYF